MNLLLKFLNFSKEINIKPALKVCDGESVYDYCWYPYMNSLGKLYIYNFSIYIILNIF